jgi:hypothetical protein
VNFWSTFKTVSDVAQLHIPDPVERADLDVFMTLRSGSIARHSYGYEARVAGCVAWVATLRW